MADSKIALVTGGSRGLGRDMAVKLAEKGFDVILTYQVEKGDAEKTVAGITSLGRKAVCLALNVANLKSIDTFHKQLVSTLNNSFGKNRFDFLINNAGISSISFITETTDEQFDKLVNTNLKGVYFLTQKVLSLLQDGGRVINISTGATRYSFPGYSVYSMVKAGVEVFTRYLAVELGKRNITANTVAPANIYGGDTWQSTAQQRDYVAGITALGRVGVPEDIGSVVAFLCTDEAHWINGQRIEITGGLFL